MRTITRVALFSLITTGCTEPGALRLVTSVDRTSLVASDSVHVSLQLVNHSWHPLTVLPAQAYGICSHAFQVFDNQGREVAVSTAFCVADLALVGWPSIELAPGASISITDWWRPLTSTLNGQPLPSGQYQLQGRVWGDDRTILSAPVGVFLE